MNCVHWYCPDCGAKGAVDTEADEHDYDTLYDVGERHREKRAGKCWGFCVVVGDESVWPTEAAP